MLSNISQQSSQAPQQHQADPQERPGQRSAPSQPSPGVTPGPPPPQQPLLLAGTGGSPAADAVDAAPVAKSTAKGNPQRTAWDGPSACMVPNTAWMADRLAHDRQGARRMPAPAGDREGDGPDANYAPQRLAADGSSADTPAPTGSGPLAAVPAPSLSDGGVSFDEGLLQTVPVSLDGLD